MFLKQYEKRKQKKMKTIKNKMKQNSRGSSIIPSKNDISLMGSSYPLLSRDIKVGRVGVMGTYTQPKEKKYKKNKHEKLFEVQGHAKNLSMRIEKGKEDEFFTNCFGIRMKRHK